jgi:hypothetical protein
MEFYSVIKKNEFLLFAGKQMELENIILSEIARFSLWLHVFSHMWNIDLIIQQFYEKQVVLWRGHK